ncbi:MAG: Do family serine endopeptidase [Gemmatimonadota bacterium]
MYDPLRGKAKVVLYSTVAFLFGLGLASGLGWTSSSHAMPVVDEAPQVSEAAVKPATDLSEAFVNLAKEVTPGVVRIEVKQPVRTRAAHPQIPEQFRRFFDFPEPNQEEPPAQGRLAGGSGFVISPDGYILTNNHVVEGADEIRVYLTDGRYFLADLVGADPFTDVAVVKIDAGEPLHAMSFGDSDEVHVGEWVLAIGNPGFGGSTFDYTVTAGIVSARGRLLGLLNRDLYVDPRFGPDQSGFAIEDFIQTDAAINPGNSGGPLVNLKGQVIGINSAIASASGYYQGYGFAVPINLARRIMEDLIEYGSVRRPLLGVEITGVAAEDAEVYGLPKVAGVLVQSVRDDGPAKGKLQPEDVIVALDGEPVGYTGQLQARIAERRPGDEVTLTVYRNKRPMEVKVKLGEAPISEKATVAEEPTAHAEERLGIRVESLDAERAQELGYQDANGVIITQVAAASPAARRGMGAFRGWKLVEVNDASVRTTNDVRDALEKVSPGEIVSFKVEDPEGRTRIVNVRMPR